MARPILRQALAVLVLVPAALGLAACGHGPSNSPETGAGCSLTVTLPQRSGHLAVAASVRAGGHVWVLRRATSTVPIGCGVTAQIEAASPAHGLLPTGWTVNGRRLPGDRIVVVVDGLLTASPTLTGPFTSAPAAG